MEAPPSRGQRSHGCLFGRILQEKRRSGARGEDFPRLASLRVHARRANLRIPLRRPNLQIHVRAGRKSFFIISAIAAFDRSFDPRRDEFSWFDPSNCLG